jgi:hypothetical protein
MLGAVAIVAVLGLGLWILLPRGGDAGRTAGPTGGSVPAPSGASAPATSFGPGTPPPSGDLPIDLGVEAGIREVIEQVPPIRGLQPLAEVPFRFITPEVFEQELRGLFAAENPAELVAAEADLLKRLGLLDQGSDLEESVLELYGSQVAAFYDPSSATFTVIERGDDADFGSSDAIIVAHEYVHALQDQHFDLEAAQDTDPDQGDATAATLALIEGDAVAVMVDWAIANLDFDEILQLQDAVTPADQELLESAPLVLRRQLEFPYTDGWAFVNAIRSGGGYEAVDAAFADRPVSTEQVMHPEKYLAREHPVVVELPDVATALGGGWTLSYQQTMGEMLIGVLVADGEPAPPPTMPGLLPALPNAEAAAGWGGDRIVSLDGPDGTWAVVWQTAWDSATDAGEFLAATEAAMDDLPFPHEIVASSVVDQLDSPVLVIVASDEATLDRLRDAVPAL